MTKTLRIAALGLALAATPAAAQVKLGFVNFERALTEIDEGKAARALLKRDFDEKQKQLNAQQEELKKLGADYQKQKSLMSEQARRDKEEELGRRQFELQQTFAQLQGELSQRENEMFSGILARMRAIVQQIAEADGFTMVFQEGALQYAQPSLDLTNELIRKYNAKHPSTGAPAAAKPKAAPPKASPAKPAAPAPAGDKK